MAVKGLCLLLLIACTASAQSQPYENFSKLVTGFFEGADWDPCNTDLCNQVHVPSFLANFEGIFFNAYAAWIKLYGDCQLATLWTQLQSLTTEQGLWDSFWRFFYNIGRFDQDDYFCGINLWETGPTNYTDCGHQLGEELSALTGWRLDNGGVFPTLKSLDEMDLSMMYLGALEGFGNEDLMKFSSHVIKLASALGELMDDLSALEEVTKEMLNLRDAYQTLKLPKINLEKMPVNFLLHMSEFTQGMTDFQECNDPLACGHIAGKLIALAFN